MLATSSMPALARSLIQAGRLSLEQASNLQQKTQTTEPPRPFIEALLESGEIDAKNLAIFCAETFGYCLLDCTALDAAKLPREVLSLEFMETHRVLPLSITGQRLMLAISDPTEIALLQQVKFQTQRNIEPVIVEYPALTRFLQNFSRQTQKQFETAKTSDIDAISEDGPVAARLEDVTEQDIDDAPIVRFLQKIFRDAVAQGASDLHFEPYEKFYRIRFRIDGVLTDIASPPLSIKEKLSSRIKVISRLDISEKRVPQDGRMRLKISSARVIDFRVSTLPTLFGEKIVMRILDSSQAQMGIDALGYEPEQKALLLDAIHRPYGMVLVTGPTGSGKTVSLYTCLNILNQPGINISTAEDPAEINLPGINQVNVNDRAGLTFPVALKAFLRQDPDIIMVGEIRDLETADISIKAAQTGHMVFSTLHTNDAPSTLTRLMNMGVPAFNIASSVILITAQRLVRRLCVCKQPVYIAKEALQEAGFVQEDFHEDWTPYTPVGCDICHGNGYKGRIGLYQIMPITEAIEGIILAHGTALEIEAQARKEGVQTLRQAGLRKVKQGLTSLEEVLGSTNL